MHATAILSFLICALLGFVGAQSNDTVVTGILGNATVVEDNPPGVIYTATLPPKQFNNPADPRGNIKGSISATADSNGIGVAFSVDLSNFPTSGGPFCEISPKALQFSQLIINQCTTSMQLRFLLMATAPRP
jgi:hypothetical protein